MSRLTLLLPLVVAVVAQPLVPSLLEYLDLTAAQITRLRTNAAEYNRFYAEKAMRYQQVSREIAEETAREVIDVQGLGGRYVEQEAICRELRAAYDQNHQRNLALLTDAQRVRLKALDVVMANARLAGAAQSANLIEPPPLGDSFGRWFNLTGLDGILGLLTAPGAVGGSGIGGVCGVPTVSATPILSKPEKEAAR